MEGARIPFESRARDHLDFLGDGPHSLAFQQASTALSLIGPWGVRWQVPWSPRPNKYPPPLTAPPPRPPPQG